jgi:hypothetical protein
MGQFWGCAAADGRPSGVLPMKNRFMVSRTSETGVLWCRFRDQKRNSGLNERGKENIVLRNKLFLAAVVALLLTPVAAVGRDKSELAAQIEAKYLTRTGVDRVRITDAGPLFVLQIGGVMAAPSNKMTMPVNKIDANGAANQIKGGSAFMTDLMESQSSNKTLAKGTHLYLIKAEVKNGDLHYWVLTTDTAEINEGGTTKPIRYKALLNFGPGYDGLTVDEVDKKLASVIAPEAYLAAHAKAAEAAASAPKTASLGMSRDDVIKALGQPTKILNLGEEKTILVYPDVKITLVKDKVTDMQ